jgi:superfamily I DNA/RNA helicase
MTDFTPTQEQKEISNIFEQGKSVVVNAYAGAGKSSTIVMIDKVKPVDKSGLYLAFNKVIADEIGGKLSGTTDSRTIHSLAYREVGRDYQHKLSRPRTGYVNVAGTASEIAKYYRILPVGETSDTEVAMLVKNTVNNFESSVEDHLTEKHINKVYLETILKRALKRNDKNVDGDSVKKSVMLYANKLWNDRIDKHSVVLATHDTYLKLYQLSKPQIGVDVLYVDEVQDITPPVVDIIKNQKDMQVVIVGDVFQSIYGWRGAINAMKHFPEFEQLNLSQSFRFGDAIAELANRVLAGRNKTPLRGFEKVDSVVGKVDKSKPYTCIYRTNSALIMDGLSLLNQGENVTLEVDTRGFVRLIESAIALYEKDYKKVKHEDLIGYKTWWELKDEAKDSSELKRLVMMVEGGQAQSTIRILKNYTPSDDAHITLITAHKSKGKEWSQVVLAEDFNPITDSTPEQEMNLIYVASTRGMNVLQVNQVLEQWLSDRGSSVYDDNIDDGGYITRLVIGSGNGGDMANQANEAEWCRQEAEEYAREFGDVIDPFNPKRKYIGR